MAYEVPRPKKRCASVMPFKFRNKVITDKNRTKSIIFNTPKTIENFYNNKEITKNKLMIYNTILKDINKYNWQNKLSKTTKLSIKDIDIIKEKHNDELIYRTKKGQNIELE